MALTEDYQEESETNINFHQRIGKEMMYQLADQDYATNSILLLNNWVDADHFTDVTLVCQDNKVLKAFRCVLAIGA